MKKQSLEDITRQFCKYCKNELTKEHDISIQAHQSCFDEITTYTEEHEISRSFDKPDATFLLDLFFLLGMPYVKKDFTGERKVNSIGRILHSHHDPVIEIEVYNKKLLSIHISGTSLSSVPDSIKDVMTLKRVWLSNNRLSEFPLPLCSLTNLEELYLDGNVFVSIPDEIGLLTSLKKLDLSGNNDAPLCMEVDERSLFTRGNKISSLPDSICLLKNLEELFLRRNSLISLPEDIGNLTNIKRLTLEGNKLTKLPESIVNLQKLTELDIDFNNLVCLPKEIGSMTNLETLSAKNNSLTELPDSIGKLTNLKKLYLGYYFNYYINPMRFIDQVQRNKISSLPPSFANLKKLEWIDLGCNDLEEYPECLTNFDSLRHLYVGWNKLPDVPNNFKKLFRNYTGSFDTYLYAGNVERRKKLDLT